MGFKIRVGNVAKVIDFNIHMLHLLIHSIIITLHSIFTKSE